MDIVLLLFYFYFIFYEDKSLFHLSIMLHHAGFLSYILIFLLCGIFELRLFTSTNNFVLVRML